MRNVRMLPRLALAVIVLVIVSCDRVPDVAGPADLGPQFNKAAEAMPGKGRPWARVAGFSVKGDSTAIYPTQTEISLGEHTLSIPPAATIGPVWFVMSGVGEGKDKDVRLTASSQNNGSNDVGSKGFRRPVTLCLHHADIPDLNAQPGRLAVAKVRSDGSFELVPSTVDATHVCAQLKSFSNYTMVTD
jgi:hypothetical protein